MKNFKGTFTALLTPFKNGKIDYDSIERMVKHQLNNGVDGFVVNGTTAESPTLTSSERIELFKWRVSSELFSVERMSIELFFWELGKSKMDSLLSDSYLSSQKHVYYLTFSYLKDF